MDEDSDLARAIAEYSNPTTSYSALEDYLMQRPVFDRGPREAVRLPQLRRLEAIEPQINTAATFRDLLEEQRTQQETARQTEIDALRDLLREELSTTAEAATAERSDLTKALEGRIADLQRGVDAQTLDLRQAGLEERADLARQIEEGDRLVREAQEAAIGDLTDRQASLVGDLGERIDALNTDLSGINDVIDSNFQDLIERQQTSASELSAIQEAAQTATEQELNLLSQRAESTQGDIGSINQQLEALGGTQTEINNLNQQLESLYADVESGNAAQSETIRNETANLISGLEQQIGGLADNLGALPIDSIQAQLAAINDQTSQFQSAVDAAAGERGDLAAQIAALRDADLTQADLAALSENIAGQRQADIAAALDPIAAQRQAEIAAAIDPIAAQRQADIASALDPIAAQRQADIAAALDPIAAQRQADIAAALDPLAAQRQADIAAALDPIAAQRQADIAAALNPLAAQRQEAISGAIDPIQQQIESLRAEIPQQIDTDALRQQLRDEIMADLPQTTSTAEAADAYGFGPNAAAAANVSDGVADRRDLFDDGRRISPRAAAVSAAVPPATPQAVSGFERVENQFTMPRELPKDIARRQVEPPIMVDTRPTPSILPPERPVKPLPVKPQPVKPMPVKPAPGGTQIILPPRELPPILFPPGDSGPIIANPGGPRIPATPPKKVKRPLPGDSGPIIANPGTPPLVPPPVKAVKPVPRIKPLPVKLPQIKPRPVKPLPIMLPQPKRKLRSPVLRTPRFGR